MGSVPFKVNLFSSLMACLALLALYLTSVSFLRVMAGAEHEESCRWPALLPVGLLAFCFPFWSNTMLAEVYTLHNLFTILIIWALLQWREKEDVRYLYCSALIYGLSAGNHGTVAFYLPAILILFFSWCRQDRWRHLSLCILFFLWGFSVYLYLPIRSLTEPTFDWGNPETLQGFLFQVTDRKDSHSHFSVLDTAAASSIAAQEVGSSLLGGITALAAKFWKVGVVLIKDLNQNMSWISVVGFLVGAGLCFRKSIPFFLFCAVIVGTNAAFFVSWRGEAFLPSYIIVSLLTALAIYRCFYTPLWKLPTGKPLKGVFPGSLMATSSLVGTVLILAIGLAIPWSALKSYIRVDHSWNYLSESLTRNVYLTLPDRAVFITGISWFFYNYNQDVRRLRDDVTAVSVWDLISPHRSGLMTPKRYPHLGLPDENQYSLNSLEGISDYTQEFLEQNSVHSPVILEQIITLYEQTKFISKLQPYRNVLLRFESSQIPDMSSPILYERSWREFFDLMNAELERPESGRDRDWANIPSMWMSSMGDYFHVAGEYLLEQEALELQKTFLGDNGRQWHFLYLDNLILSRRLGKAEVVLEHINQRFPNSYEFWMGKGLFLKASGNYAEAMEPFNRAASLQPASFRPYLEMAVIQRGLNNKSSAQAFLISAQKNLQNLRQVQKYREEVRRFEASFL